MPSDEVPPPWSAPSASPSTGLPKADARLHEPPTGQLILGTDKRNPVFAVYEDQSGERLLVYYGFEIIEIVNNDPEDPGYKLLLGRLYNSGIKLSALCESFQIDPKTVRRWGAVLLKGDAVEMIRVLEGRGARRKRTVAVERFARLRWPDLVAQGSYGAVGRLREEIRRVFAVDVSRSGLQSLIRELKAEPVPSDLARETAAAESSPPTHDSEESEGLIPSGESVDGPPEPEIEKREIGVRSLAEDSAESVPNSAVIKCLNDNGVTSPPGNTAHPSPFFPKDPSAAHYWCDHAGVLIFATALAAVSKVSATSHAILAQWIAALWLGAQNIEQTKFLNWEDLELILGGVVRFPTPQRDQLKSLSAEVAVVDSLFQFNQENLGSRAIGIGADFYFDPHTKHYTGEQNVLKGWCPKIRFADKVMHSDFIHTPQGEPIYFETTDNFADLRQRFPGVIERARKALLWPRERVLTFVVDRGVYGQEFFQKVIDDPHWHLITWQKGFVAQTWDSLEVMGKTTITRFRNSSADLRGYQFEYIDRPWEQNSKLRQIVVQATDYKGRTIQVAILTDDLKRAAAEIIRLMFQRWLQENDFKYLDKHFGINQITSYRSIEYGKLKGQVEDREVKSVARKALDMDHKKEIDRLKRNLLAEEQALQAHQRRVRKLKELHEQLANEGSTDTPQHKTLSRRVRALKTVDQRYENSRLERRKSIDQGNKRLEEIQTQIDGTQAKESRLDAVIQAQMVKMDSQCKRLMDVLRITARNLFYQALQPFKKAYDNYRDDHDHFRNLTQSPGVLEVSAEQIVVHLLPRTNYGGELRKIVCQTLEGINAKGLHHPCLPGMKLKFRLGRRSEMELKMNVDA